MGNTNEVEAVSNGNRRVKSKRNIKKNLLDSDSEDESNNNEDDNAGNYEDYDYDDEEEDEDEDGDEEEQEDVDEDEEYEGESEGKDENNGDDDEDDEEEDDDGSATPDDDEEEEDEEEESEDDDSDDDQSVSENVGTVTMYDEDLIKGRVIIEGKVDDDDDDNDITEFLRNENGILERKESNVTRLSETEEERMNNILSSDELERARQVFHHCDTYGEEKLNEEQFGIALALLGLIERTEYIRYLYSKQKVDPMPESNFINCLAEIRMNNLLQTAGGNNNKKVDNTADENSNAKPLANTSNNVSDYINDEVIDSAFEALYHGTNPDDTNRDETGRKYILARDFRLILTTEGEKLSDEEADQLIRECRPKYEVNPHDGTVIGKIFLEQYRSLLLDKSV